MTKLAAVVAVKIRHVENDWLKTPTLTIMLDAEGRIVGVRLPRRKEKKRT